MRWVFLSFLCIYVAGPTVAEVSFDTEVSIRDTKELTDKILFVKNIIHDLENPLLARKKRSGVEDLSTALRKRLSTCASLSDMVEKSRCMSKYSIPERKTNYLPDAGRMSVEKASHPKRKQVQGFPIQRQHNLYPRQDEEDESTYFSVHGGGELSHTLNDTSYPSEENNHRRAGLIKRRVRKNTERRSLRPPKRYIRKRYIKILPGDKRRRRVHISDSTPDNEEEEHTVSSISSR